MNTSTNSKIQAPVPDVLIERLLTFRKTNPARKMTLRGHTWSYMTCGEGKECLVLLSGTAGFGETWFSLIEELEGEYRLIVPTYPPVTTIADLVEGIHSLLQQAQVPRANILGTSMGGWIGQCFVRKYPALVDKLILSNTSGPEGFKPIQYKSTIAAARVLPPAVLKSINKRQLLKMIQAQGAELQFWRAYWDEKDLLHITKQTIMNQLYAMADYILNYDHSPGDLSGWPGKILIIESDDDVAFPLEKRNGLKALYPGAQVHTLHNGGHTPAFRGIPEYIAAVKGFLQSPVT